ncbi:hypothetical protein VNO77_03000 [Canavalia gladiata]|uniref:Uncharacterized protein n=1 Tax=Canavalia gladiata TaxID=3824 RepID=A0AAN9R7R7_CANGL
MPFDPLYFTEICEGVSLTKRNMLTSWWRGKLENDVVCCICSAVMIYIQAKGSCRLRNIRMRMRRMHGACKLVQVRVVLGHPLIHDAELNWGVFSVVVLCPGSPCMAIPGSPSMASLPLYFHHHVWFPPLNYEIRRQLLLIPHRRIGVQRSNMKNTIVLLLVDPHCSYKSSISISINVAVSRLLLLYCTKMVGCSIAVVFDALMQQAFSWDHDLQIPIMVTAMESNLTLLLHFFHPSHPCHSTHFPFLIPFIVGVSAASSIC